MPAWVRRALDSPTVLKWAAGSAAKTRAADVGDLTVSMLRGEEGRQAAEIDQLVDWLKGRFSPDAICLSNALLLGIARQLKRELNVPVTVLLAGEDAFLDGLPEPHRGEAWRLLRERAREVDGFIAPSVYFRDLMERRLQLAPGQATVVYAGINLEGFRLPDALPHPPVIGFFARMCKEKGLHTLVEAFVRLKERDRVKHACLRVGGGLSPVDESTLLRELRGQLGDRALLEQVEFLPNLNRGAKLEFFRSLSVLSVPALYGEAFGLYLLEAWASGVPVVQPRHAAFPELLELSGAGVLCEPGDPVALAEALEEVLLDAERLQSMGRAGARAVAEQFSIERMAENLIQTFERLPKSASRPTLAVS
jgi:glycosyltransferase involved in cell wall biosynthesis